MRIDAHQHYWRIGCNGHQWPTPDLAAIHRDFLPGDLDPLLATAGIGRTIAVQSQPDDRDTDWLIALAAETPSIAGVVGWVDFAAPDAAAQIAALAPNLVGLRPMLQGLEPGWILDPAIAPALEAMVRSGLVFDALIKPRHLGDILVLAERYPDLRIVIDHAAKPDVAGGVREPWAAEIAALAALPNVTCKLSGLVTEAADDWSVEDLRVYVRHLLHCFGAQRLIWGSDWPVLLLAGSYQGWIDTCEQLLADLGEGDRAALFGGTAARVYRIGESE